MDVGSTLTTDYVYCWRSAFRSDTEIL